MRQRLLGLLAWLVLVFIMGAGRLLWTVLRAVVWLRFRSLLALGCVVAIAQSSDAPTVQRLFSGVGPYGHMILFAGGVVLVLVIVARGVRSPATKRVRRRFRFH